MSRNGREGLGWPAQWVEPLFIPPILTAPTQSPLTKGLSYQACTQPLPRSNHQQKSSPKQHINSRRLFERTNYGSSHPWPMPSNEKKTEHRHSEQILSIIFTKHLNSTTTMPDRTDHRKGSQETSFRTPYRNTLRERKTNNGWDKHKHVLQAHMKKQVLP